MKQAWVRLSGWSDEAAVAAIESGADALVLPRDLAGRARALGRIVVISPDEDAETGGGARFEPLGCAEDEARVRELLRAGGTVVIEPSPSGSPRPAPRGWEVIPLENLVAAGSGRLFVPVDSLAEIELALGVLERGVAGVVIASDDPAEIRRLVLRVKKAGERETFHKARIENIKPAGMGDRVCVDTCTHMGSGEGMLVGNASGFFFFVQAETEENPYVAPRPFRVNAGPVHSYVRVPGGRTRYLSELRAGERVLVFRPDGEAQEATVGRVKMERRPLVLVEADCDGRKGSILLQNAETIRLAGPGGEPLSVARLEAGDEVLVAVETPGRHFGMKVDETIREV